MPISLLSEVGKEDPPADPNDFAERKWQISANGGSIILSPRWRRDGRELFFKTPLNSKLMAVTLRTVPTFEPGVPRLLFAPPFASYGNFNNFAVTADGQRFLVRIPSEFASTPATVVVNWTKLFTR